MRPNVRGSEKAMQANRKISTQFVHAVGFSNGWAEFALKNPPPLVPSSLMASWLATGPPGIVCCPPASVLTTWVCRSKFWMVPPTIRMTAPTMEIGSRIRRVPRTRSTQKLPSSPVLRRARPRMKAIATAMPTAADTKFCTARPAICTRWPCVDSPEYACQLVFVTKLTAVFQASAGVICVAGSLRCSGSLPCTNWRMNRNRMLIAENASTLRA